MLPCFAILSTYHPHFARCLLIDRKVWLYIKINEANTSYYEIIRKFKEWFEMCTRSLKLTLMRDKNWIWKVHRSGNTKKY